MNLDILAAQPEFTSGEGVSDEAIRHIRGVAGGVVSKDYENFLSKFGFAIWFGGEIFGIYELGSVLPPSYDLDAERQTFKARSRAVPKCFEDFSQQGLVVAKYEGGGFYFLHNVDGTKSGRVSLFEFGEEAAPTHNWESFSRFVESMIQQSGGV